MASYSQLRSGTMSSNNTRSNSLYQYKYNLIGDRVIEVETLTVHRFQLGDVEDPILYAGEPLMKWQNSECGKWVMDHAVETPSWHQQIDHASFGYTFIVCARLKAKDATYFRLKWGQIT